MINRNKQRHEPIKAPSNNRHSLEAREKSRVHGAFDFGFACHWLKNWRDSFKPITTRSNRNHVITFDRHLKTALWIWYCLHLILGRRGEKEKHRENGQEMVGFYPEQTENDSLAEKERRGLGDARCRELSHRQCSRTAYSLSGVEENLSLFKASCCYFFGRATEISVLQSLHAIDSHRLWFQSFLEFII